MAGKGDKRRPRKVDEETFSKNWDRIFSKIKDDLLQAPEPDSVQGREEFAHKNRRHKV